MKLDHRKKGPIDDDAVIATAMILLIAGYDTTGMTLSFLSYYLADQPDIQSRLQDEIDTAFEDNDGQLPDYQTIQELPYLEACILETIRMFTPVGFILRSCVKDYTVPEVGLEVKVNDLVLIPAAGIHRDASLYPNPTVFNPDHFSKEARMGRSPYAFQGFGQGPRACIGMRFAMLELKVGMMEVLRRFTFRKSAKNPARHTLDPSSQLGYVKEGLFVKIERRS